MAFGAKGKRSAISTSFSACPACPTGAVCQPSSSTTTPRLTPTSSQRRDTRSASQPGKRTLRIGPAAVWIREMGRSPKAERARRSVRMRLRSWIARAKSDVRVERRSMSLRDVTSRFDFSDEKEGQRAVMVGLNLNSRFVPFIEEDIGDSHCE